MAQKTQTTTPFDLQKFYETIEHYEAYYNGKRTPRQKYIMTYGVNRFVNNNDLENPNQYILYLMADKALNCLTSKSEQGRITQLEDELQKDLHLLQRMESFNI
jgi:hypothetical protein